MPPRTEIYRRMPRLLFGIVLFGVGVSMMIISGLGLSPWEVLHQGVSVRTGIPIGTVTILTGIVVLLLWIPLKERAGIGTICNALLIGIVMDLTLWAAPSSVDSVWMSWVLLLGGILLVGIGSGFYIGVGMGPGPRDGLMTGLARKGIPIGVARAAVELSVLGIGWLLGGTAGIGTILFAFGMGPLVHVLLPRMSLEPIPPPLVRTQETL